MLPCVKRENTRRDFKRSQVKQFINGCCDLDLQRWWKNLGLHSNLSPGGVTSHINQGVFAQYYKGVWFFFSYIFSCRSRWSALHGWCLLVKTYSCCSVVNTKKGLNVKSWREKLSISICIISCSRLIVNQLKCIWAYEHHTVAQSKTSQHSLGLTVSMLA